MSKWNVIPTQEAVDKTAESLIKNGIRCEVVESGKKAKEKVLELVPKGAEVMTMTSVTLDTIGLDRVINESGDYDALRPKLFSMDRNTQGKEMRQIGSVPEWSVGSAHAVTQEGQVLIASNTGSQLPAYAYGGAHVIWVVGAQKIVKNLDEGFRRIYEYTLPLESERAKKAYGAPGSAVNKMLTVNKEVQPDRLTMILVMEVLGF